MMKVGILGFGFVGKLHMGTLRKGGLAEVTAVADKNPANLAEGASTEGNIAMDAGLAGLAGVTTYGEGDELLQDPNLDVVLIALPTYLHKEYLLKALQTDKQIICEKPFLRTAAEGEEVLAAIDKAGRPVFVAHCIRFWPAYAKAREVVQEGDYGKVLRAHFIRRSPKPTWSWQDWLLDDSKSGGCALDMHIHDVDYVNYVFGAPAGVRAEGVRVGNEGVTDVLATYEYDDGKLITVEGSWEHQPAYPFRMAFRLMLEGATLEFNTLTDGKLHIYTADGETLTPELSEEDGYTHEFRYFFECMDSGKAPTVVTPSSSVEALALVERELA